MKWTLLFHWLCRSFVLARFKVKSKHINTNIPIFTMEQPKLEKKSPKTKVMFISSKTPASAAIFFYYLLTKHYLLAILWDLRMQTELFHKIGLHVLLRPLYVESFVETWGGQVSKSRGAITRKLWPEIETISRKMGILWHRVAEVGSLSASAKMLTFFLYLLFSRQRRRFCT